MTDAFVVDTGVFVRWFVDQPGYQHARRIWTSYNDGDLWLETVDFARIEVAEVLRKKGLLAGRLSRDEFIAAASVIDDIGIRVHRSDADLLWKASSLASRFTLRIFDSLFVQIALERGIPLLTTDRRLSRAVANVAPTQLLDGVEPPA